MTLLANSLVLLRAGLAVFVALFASAFAPTPSTAEAEWTILVYMDADNDLEPNAVDDFLEMAGVGSSEEINLIVQMDRAPGNDSRFGDWTGARRGRVAPGDTPSDGWGEDAGEPNMGDPQTAVDFLKWGLTEWPSRRAAVIFWSHGNGWPPDEGGSTRGLFAGPLDETAPGSTGRPPATIEGIGDDQTDGGDTLSLAELRSVFVSLAASGHEADLIGFDACLMAMTEVAYDLREHAEIMVGSEENEPGAGWPYLTILGDLSRAPGASPEGLGAIIVQRYHESVGGNLTQSAVRLGEMGALASAVDAFAQSLRLNHVSNPAACALAGEAVVAAIEAAVVAERHGAEYAPLGGLSIYFPDERPIDAGYTSVTLQFAEATRWEEFLADFRTVLGGTWIETARSETQTFRYPPTPPFEYVDLYDFCARVYANAPDAISVQPNEPFTADGDQGGPFAPDSKQYLVVNGGDGTLYWEATVDRDWVEVAPDFGMLEPGGITTCVVTLNAAAEALPEGLQVAEASFQNVETGLSRRRRIELKVDLPLYFTELFDEARPFDLAGRSLTFTPDGSWSFYRACVEAADAFHTDPSTGTTLALTDDSFAEVALGDARVFLYGVGYDRLFVGSNGYLTFDAGDVAYHESVATHFNHPRVAGLFRDLNPSWGGEARWVRLADRIAVTYDGVVEMNTSYANRFQIELFFDGAIRLTYLDVGSARGLVGLSAGEGPPADFYLTDLSALICDPPQSPAWWLVY